MATSTIPNSAGKSVFTIKEAVELLSREERFMATVAAMNTLLIAKGIYTQSEFDDLFCRWAAAQQSKPGHLRPGRQG
jgi:hypothetical protein